MRLGRGLFRIWCAVSVVWMAVTLVFAGAMVHGKAHEMPKEFIKDRECGIYFLSEGIEGMNSCIEAKKVEFIADTGWQPSYDVAGFFVLASVMGVFPSISFGVMLYSMLWVVRGFIGKDESVLSGSSETHPASGGKGPWGPWSP